MGLKFPFFKQKSAPLLPPRILSYQTATLQGLGTRQRQEDAYMWVNPNDPNKIIQQGLLALVADGMGGMADGAMASSQTVRTISAAFETWNRETAQPHALFAAVQAADRTVWEQLHGAGGSTLIACHFYQEQLLYASVGDSSLFLCRDGLLTQLNEPQTLRQEKLRAMLRRGQCDPSDLSRSKEDAALSSYVGMGSQMEIDGFHRRFQLRNGDVLLLCSDGVSGVLSEDQLLSCMQAGTAEEICQALDMLIRRKAYRSQDNYTALVVRCIL